MRSFKHQEAGFNLLEASLGLFFLTTITLLALGAVEKGRAASILDNITQHALSDISVKPFKLDFSAQEPLSFREDEVEAALTHTLEAVEVELQAEFPGEQYRISISYALIQILGEEDVHIQRLESIGIKGSYSPPASLKTKLDSASILEEYIRKNQFALVVPTLNIGADSSYLPRAVVPILKVYLEEESNSPFLSANNNSESKIIYKAALRLLRGDMTL